MIKKLFKYGKILMALTLISALTLPSYATVGASDGSAFVTKAEFDAALSDFNARLTTFEAGINSKIDSQVSSYLDRNGIWNGKAQEYDPSGGGNHRWFVTPKDLCDVDGYETNTMALAFLSQKGRITTSPSADREVGSIVVKGNAESVCNFDFKDIFYQVLIPNISKTGLLFLQLKQDEYNVFDYPPIDRQIVKDGFRNNVGRFQTLIEVGNTKSYSDTPQSLRITRYLGTYINGNKDQKSIAATTNLVDYNVDVSHWTFIREDYTKSIPDMFMYGPLDWRSGRTDVYQFFVQKGDSVIYGVGGSKTGFQLRTLFASGYIDGVTIIDCKVY